MKKLELRLRDKKTLKNDLDDGIYFKKKQMRLFIIIDKKLSIDKYNVFLALRRNKKIKKYWPKPLSRNSIS